MVNALASCARGPGFYPRQRRGKFVGPNRLRVICRYDMNKCAVLRIGTLTGWGMKAPAEPSCRARAAELDILNSYFWILLMMFW